MNCNNNDQTFSEYLDKEMQNKLLVRFVFSKDFSKISAFSISLISIIAEEPREIIRFDATVREKTNVHRFYNNPPTKQYLEKEKNFETLEECIKNIRNKWNEYRLKYLENRQ